MKKMNRPLTHAAIAMILATISLSSFAFAAWQVVDGVSFDSGSLSPSFTPQGGTVVENDSALAFFGMSESTIEGENLSYRSHTSYTYETDSTGAYVTDTEGNYVLSSQETTYSLDSSLLSVVMDLDQNSTSFNDMEYDNASFHSIAVDLKIVEYSSSQTFDQSFAIAGTPLTIKYPSLSGISPTFELFSSDKTQYLPTDGNYSISSGTEVYFRVLPNGREGDRSAVARPHVDLGGTSLSSCSPIVGGGADSYWYGPFSFPSSETSLNVVWPTDLTSSFSSYLTTENSGTVRPHNLPTYEFEMTASSSNKARWYFPMKSTQDMSLYSLFKYDHSYESKSNTNERTIPIDFCFNFDSSKVNEIVPLLTQHSGAVFYVSFTILSQSQVEGTA